MLREGDFRRLIYTASGDVRRDRDISLTATANDGLEFSVVSLNADSSNPTTLESSGPRSERLMLSTGSDSLKI